MAKEVKRLYRSDDGVIAGVCAGIAEYCDIDPVIVRILAVLLSISSFGVVVLIYVLLWLVMPRKLSASDPISCDAYLKVDGTAQTGQSAPPPAGSRPIPPVGHEAYNAGYAAYASAARQAGQENAAPYAAHYEAVASMGANNAARRDTAGMGGTTRVAVWAGVILLFIGVAALLSSIVDEVSWWQLWPCLIILAGLVEMVVPSRRKSWLRRFSRGMVVFAIGVVLLLITVHFLSWRTLAVMFNELWPMLLIALGIDIISYAVKNEVLSFAAALCVVAMIVCGVAGYAVPGTLEQLTVHPPFMGTHVFEVNPWN